MWAHGHYLKINSNQIPGYATVYNVVKWSWGTIDEHRNHYIWAMKTCKIYKKLGMKPSQDCDDIRRGKVSITWVVKIRKKPNVRRLRIYLVYNLY